jgi:hypothetical protein
VQETVISVDVAETRRRTNRLRRYVKRTLLDGDEFICPHFKACRESIKPGHQFREGTMSHVGRRFDLVLNGKPLRVMVVGQESGLPKDLSSPWASKVGMTARSHQVHDVTGLHKRYYAEPGHPGRNPHMRGTTSLLRTVFSKGLGDDYEGELVTPVNGNPFHIFDGFALVNRLLCSAGPIKTSQGRPTRTMLGNCATHFAATVSILEPTLVILQGSLVAKSMSDVLMRRRAYSEHLHEAQIGAQRMLVCSFSHPSAHGAVRWGDQPRSAYMQEVVVPTLRAALRRG